MITKGGFSLPHGQLSSAVESFLPAVESLSSAADSISSAVDSVTSAAERISSAVGSLSSAPTRRHSTKPCCPPRHLRDPPPCSGCLPARACLPSLSDSVAAVPLLGTGSESL